MTRGLIDASALPSDVEASFDAVVVGSGAGGAVVAKELAEGGMRVALVEEGAPHRERKKLAWEELGTLYRDMGMTTTLGRPFIPVPLGRCFGGTTLINSGTCFRTPETVLAQWRDELGLSDLDAATMDEAFARVEDEIHVEKADVRVMSRSNVLMDELLTQEGFTGAPLRRNTRGCEGCGMCCYGCNSYAKQSMEVSYLPKALKAGMTAYTSAKAVRLLRDSAGAATGILARGAGPGSKAKGVRLTLRAPIVIVACGTLITPAFLKRNRIARRNAHLGRHLTIHPATKVYAEFEEDIRDWMGIPQAYYLDAFHDEGVMYEGVSMPPDLGPIAMPFTGERLAHFITRYRNVMSFGFMISDTAEGSMVRLPFLGHTFRYALTQTDLERVRRAIAFLSRVFLRGGAKAVYPLVTTANNVFTRLDEVDRFEEAPLAPDDVEMMAFHPLGTCRMASTPETGVCDPFHQVYGTPGLYISDGSVVPSALGVNPQVTIMALATRLADHLLAKAPSAL